MMIESYQYKNSEIEISRKVAVIGGGIAGLTAALALKQQGIDVEIFDKQEKPGGHLNQWHILFPAREDATMLVNSLIDEINSNNLKINTQTEITSVKKIDNQFTIESYNKKVGQSDAIIMATGFELFNASRKEEYGYGIYPRVITSSDLEHRLGAANKGLIINGLPPGKVGFVHCVGSRDAQVGNHYCSKVCCVTGVKQAITVKELYPGCDVVNFYMDLRMYGTGYEELYQEAQEKYGITFIRGRVSEASQNRDGSIQLKTEDTLLGRPVIATFDWLILLTGMEPSQATRPIATSLGMNFNSAGFLTGIDKFLKAGISDAKGVFIAGACTGPASIPDSIAQGRSAAVLVLNYLSPQL